MAEALLTIATDLLKPLGSIAVQQIQQEKNLIVGVDKEIEKLSNSFEKVKAMLNNAEKRQFTKAAVKPPLDQLRDLYHMMDDVLDKWNTARIKSKIQKEEKRAVTNNSPAALVMKVLCSFFTSLSCCFGCFGQVDNLSLRHEIGHKIEELKQTLDNIVKDKATYGFDLTGDSPVEVERTLITSFGDVSDIIGRDDYRDELFSNLLGGGSQELSNPRVISLVGMGGIGKSTLAQLAYNDDKIQAHFQPRIWVCVSDPFDQCKVAKAIIESIEVQSPNIIELQSLLARIRDLIRGKKFFLVLDDVWTEESTKWEPFKNALKCGAQGSRILVTTRKNNVSEMMESSHKITLEELSDNECWLMFSKIAFSNKDPHQRRDLEDIGKQLASKCKGLPLAAKTLGSHMLKKNSRGQWERVLRNSLWEVEDVEKGLLGPLLLSYNELSLSEKQCFLFCVVYNKDHQYNRLDLINHWMAQGYINSKENTEMEDIVEECFEKLAMCSFFQDFEKDMNDDRIISCKMHDIVHDFAQLMTKHECFRIEGDEEVQTNFRRARQLSLVVKETFPESIYEAKNLRFLNLDFTCSQIVQPKLFDNLTCLRTLHLKGQSIIELPNEVEKLIHLRLLKLSCEEIKELPKSICNLCNLQSLDVSKCEELEKLPQGIGKLINLRHLLLGDLGGIKSFPKGIGRLTCLKTLTYFLVGKGEEICKLGELEYLNHIQGQLGIFGLNNVVDFGAIENTLKKKNHLRDLYLFFKTLEEFEKEEEEEEETEEERRRKMEKDVAILNALEPPPCLEFLLIGCNKGTTMYPNWMMSKLTYLKKLEIRDCPNLKLLPPLGKLPLLEKLYIQKAPKIRKVGDEFLGIDIEEEELSESSKNNNSKDIIIFPNLRSLEFYSLDMWEEWTGMGGTTEEEEEEKDNSANAFVTNNTPNIKIMPLLHSLTIGDCGNLKSLPDYLRNTPLQELNIKRCPILKQRCERGIGDSWPNISHIPNIRIDYKYVQRDGQLGDSADSEFDDLYSDDDEEDDGAGFETENPSSSTTVKGCPSNPETLPNRHLRRSVTVPNLSGPNRLDPTRHGQFRHLRRSVTDLKPDSGRSSGSKHKDDDDEGDF